MLTTAVESTTIATVTYDASAQLLWLEFQTGVVYCYLGVPPTLYQDLIAAGSKENYFNRKIRGGFPYRRQPDAGYRADPVRL